MKLRNAKDGTVSAGWCIVPGTLHFGMLQRILFLLMLSIPTVLFGKEPSSATPADTTIDTTHTVTLDRLTVTAPRMKPSTEYRTAVFLIDSSTLSSLPGTAEDINRMLTLMPFASGRFNAVNNELSVRGGQSLENVYIVNGIELDDINHFSNVFHSGGSSTYLDPHSIDGIEFDGGAFSASLPPRISSAITITTKQSAEHPMSHRYNANVSGLNASVNGLLPDAAGAFLSTLRYANMAVIKKMVPLDGSPVFADFLGTARYGGAKRSLLFTTLTGVDRFEEDPERDADDPYAQYSQNIIQTANGLYYEDTLDGLTVNGSVFGVYRNSDTRDSAREPLYPDTFHMYDENGFVPDSILVYRPANQYEYIDRMSIATGGVTFSGKKQVIDGMTVDIGCSFLGSRTLFTRWYNYERTMLNEAGDTLIFTPAGFREYLLFRGRSGGYLQWTWGNDLISAVAGIRGDYWHYLHEAGISPRASVSVAIPHTGTLSISGGRIYQEPSLFNRLIYLIKLPGSYVYQSGPDVDIDDFALQRCTSVSIELRRTSAKAGTFTLGGYYKYYDREFLYRKPGITALMLDYIDVMDSNEPSFTIPDNSGRKRVSGFEAYYETAPFMKYVHAVASYTFFSVENRFENGRWVDDINDIRHKFDAGIRADILKHHALAARITWCGGRPYSPAVFRKDSIDEFITYSRDWDDPDSYNSARLDPLLLISPRYSYHRQFEHFSLSLFVEVMNVLNTRTVIERTTTNWGYKDIISTGILPMFGVELQF